MEQLTKNQAVATSQEAVQNQNEPQLRDENAHNDKSVHGVLNPTYQAGLRRDAVQPDIEAERKKRDEIEFFFSSRRRHTSWNCDWSSDVCSSDLRAPFPAWRPASSSGGTSRTRWRTRGDDTPCRRWRWRNRRARSGGDDARSATRAERQIGRASCRERVMVAGAVLALDSCPTQTR